MATGIMNPAIANGLLHASKPITGRSATAESNLAASGFSLGNGHSGSESVENPCEIDSPPDGALSVPSLLPQSRTVAGTLKADSSKPLVYDLYSGLGGWAEGFLAEGYEVIGFDIERHDYGTGGYPGKLILRDVRSIHGSELKDATVIVASPPCQAYSYRAMPWKRAKALPPPDNTLFDACFRIQREASEAAGHYIPMVVENVRGAQKWVGLAQWHYGSFYLWGDVPALMPIAFGTKISPEINESIRRGVSPARWTNPAEHYFNQCTCPTECDCQSPESEVALISAECPVHNWNPVPSLTCVVHGEHGIKLPGNNAPRRREDLQVKWLRDATKVPGITLSRGGGAGFNVEAAKRYREGLKLKDQDGYERHHANAFGRKAPKSGIHCDGSPANRAGRTAVECAAKGRGNRMSTKTSIEWTDATWSPIRVRVKADAATIARAKGYTSLISTAAKMAGRIGPHCEHVSPGCEHCYAETNNHRCLPGNGTGLPYDRRSRDLVEPFIDERILLQPLRWKTPRKIFVENQSDLFGEWVPDESIDRVFAVMALCPQHTFQVLTKRPERMLEWFTKKRPAYMSKAAADTTAWHVWREVPGIQQMVPPETTRCSFRWNHAEGGEAILGWPLPNVWPGVSCEDQPTADARIPLLLQTPAAVRFVSAEPLLGALRLAATPSKRYPGTVKAGYLQPTLHANDAGGLYETPPLDWVIVGGESGPGARPCDVESIRSIVQQCKSASVPVFVKQLGAHPGEVAYPQNVSESEAIHWQRKGWTRIWDENGNHWRKYYRLEDRKGGDWSEWPEDLRVREFPEGAR